MQWIWREHRGLLINNLIIVTGGLTCFKLGQYLHGKADKWVGLTSWKSPKFLGNSGRSPIYPYSMRPYVDEVEERVAYDRKYN